MSGRLRSYARLPRESQKVKDGAHDFRAVYADVDARSEGRCEWTEYTRRHGLLSAKVFLGVESDKAVDIVRCRKRAAEHHHTVKPRRSNHAPALVIHLCYEHHDRCSWPFPRGKAVATARGDGTFECAIRYAASKFQARGQGE